MAINKHLLILSIIFSVVACKKTATPAVISTVPYTSELKVTVVKDYLNKGNQPVDSALKNTFVYGYNSDYDRANNNPPAFIGETDSTGLVIFNGLTQTEYYLRVSSKKFGVKDDDVNTPPNGVALAEIDY